MGTQSRQNWHTRGRPGLHRRRRRRQRRRSRGLCRTPSISQERPRRLSATTLRWKLPPGPRLCRGKDCSGIPCEEEEPGFSYSHIKDLVICPNAEHTTMANRDGCYLWQMWPAKKRAKKPAPGTAPAKNFGGETSGARNTWPHTKANTANRSNQRQTGKPGKFNGSGKQLGGTPLLSRAESLQRLEILLLQIYKATEHSAIVVVHGDFNLDLDRSNNGGYYMGPCSSSWQIVRPPLAWRRIAPAKRLDRLAAFVVLLKDVTALKMETPYVRRETPQVRLETDHDPQEVGKVLQETKTTMSTTTNTPA
jgi:hypothetical protein